MPHGEVKEVSILDAHKNTLHCDAVPSLLRERLKLIALFPITHAITLFRRFPVYVEEVRNGFARGRLEALRPSKTKRDRLKRNYLLKSTVQLMPGDEDLTKVNPFQGERKIDSRWGEANYEIACQVANGSSSYEKQDSSSKMKASHRNRFFLVATLYGASTALCQNEYADIDPTTHSAPAESTLKECDIDLLRDNMEEQQS